MSHHEHSTEAGHQEAAHHEHPNYVKIWAILVVLLLVSVAGPFVGIRVVTLVTAFGVALVKAYMVAKNFMHLNVQRPFVIYLLVTVLAFMVLFFGGVSPDVMKHAGRNWQNDKALAAIQAGHEEIDPAYAVHQRLATEEGAGESAAP